ncbi:MAG: MFS transporter, partial [Desulfobacterales bacterium]|nr:MFS transporter [Desulfobacterales bacterium]
GVMAVQWQQLPGVEKARIGQLMFFVLTGTGCAMYLSGKLQEKVTPRRLIFMGTVACGFGAGAVGWASVLYHLFAWAFWEGFFSAFVYLPCLTVSQKLFLEQKGLAAGVNNLVFGGAAAVMSPVFSFLLVNRGYRATCVISMALAVCTGIVCAFFMRGSAFSIKSVKGSGTALGVGRILALKSFWALWWIWALAGAAGVSMVMLCASLGQSLGYDVTRYVMILTGFSMLNGLGRIVFGILADRISKHKILIRVFLMAALAYLLMPFFRNLYVLSLLASIVGLAFGVLFTVSAPLVSECFGLENFGRVFGLVFTAYGFMAGFLGPWMSGVVLTLTHDNFMIVFAGFALFYLVAAFLVNQIHKV